MTAFVNSDLWSTHLALKLLRYAVQNTLVNDESPLKLAVMETTGRYVTRIEIDKGGAIARIAIYARLSRDPRGLNVNTSIQVAECLEETRRYVEDRVLQARIVAIFEENDISASAYSKKSASISKADRAH